MSNFTLDANGKGYNNTDSIQLSGKLSQAGGYAASSVKFTYTVKKQSLFASLGELGFSNATVVNQPITLPLLMVLDGNGYLANVAMTYTAKKSQEGTAKQ